LPSATTSAQNTGGAGNDTVSGFENLIGSDFSDVLTGSAAVNVIDGGDGNDVIRGGGGGHDLTGGAGNDRFLLGP
jgi:Ca2+-binding RTX toxin-like protein